MKASKPTISGFVNISHLSPLIFHLSSFLKFFYARNLNLRHLRFGIPATLHLSFISGEAVADFDFNLGNTKHGFCLQDESIYFGLAGLVGYKLAPFVVQIYPKMPITTVNRQLILEDGLVFGISFQLGSGIIGGTIWQSNRYEYKK